MKNNMEQNGRTDEIYLDYAAATPLDLAVADQMQQMQRCLWGNPASQYQRGQRAAALLADAHASVALSIGANPEEIYFTSGGTESDNWAIKGYAFCHRIPGKREHLIISQAEHPAVIETGKYLERQGFSVTWLPVNSDGLTDPSVLQAAMQPGTLMVCIMHANNESGVIQPLQKLAAITHCGGAVLFSDGVAASGHIPIDLHQLGVDLYALSAHKFFGPVGCGALYIRNGISVVPLIHGGGQQDALRSGTEAAVLCQGLSLALMLAEKRQTQENNSVLQLRNLLEEKLTAIPGSLLNGSRDGRIPHTLNVSFDGVTGEALTALLDMKGIAVSAGSACHAGRLQPSHVLLAMGRTPQQASGAIRFSLSHLTTEAQINTAALAVKTLVSSVRSAHTQDMTENGR